MEENPEKECKISGETKFTPPILAGCSLNENNNKPPTKKNSVITKNINLIRFKLNQFKNRMPMLKV